jgi:hypothetical protein
MGQRNMDRQGFRAMLEGRKVPAGQLDSALALAERFEQFAKQMGGLSAETAWAFSRRLVAEGQASLGDFLTLGRYGLFIKNNAVFVALLELLDGAEAQENLYRRVAERYGESLRDDVFAGIGIAPLGIPMPKKPRYMQPVIERLEKALGTEACRALLADSLRDLPDEYYIKNCEMYQASQDVDKYLALTKQEFVSQLETCQREGRLFFAQEVTDQVLEYIRREPEMGGGVRIGKVVYETKIPFLTREYLAESDPRLRRYYYCHCPWAREAIRSGEKVTPIFCNCSAGYHKKPWEGALGQRIHADVLDRCFEEMTAAALPFTCQGAWGRHDCPRYSLHAHHSDHDEPDLRSE